MSDAQKLKDCIKEYRKNHKDLNKRLTQIEVNRRQARQEQTDQSSRQD